MLAYLDQSQRQCSLTSKYSHVCQSFLLNRNARSSQPKSKKNHQINHRHQHWSSKVCLLTFSEKKILWTPLALGADKAIYVHTTLRHDTELQPLLVAQVLRHFIER